MAMLAPIATLIFLAALWVTVRIVADLLEQGLPRIAAALRGEPPAEIAPPVTVRQRPMRLPARRPPMRAQPQWRAAA